MQQRRHWRPKAPLPDPAPRRPKWRLRHQIELSDSLIGGFAVELSFPTTKSGAQPSSA
uniref:Uncharacterized protein n=1 Tax=Arundo donax TaxID=35708 RepID=A0A0A9AU57_ARUDO